MARQYHGKRFWRWERGTVLAAAAIFAVLALAAVAAAVHGPWQREAGAASSQPGSSFVPAGGSISLPDTSSSGSAAQAQGTVNIPVKTPAPYNFSRPVPEQAAVDNHYFDDAAFVGDSRTDGFMIYSGIGTGTNLTSNGLSIFELAEKKALTIGGEKYTLLEALSLEEYGKVYLSLGVNELGYDDDEGFYKSYSAAIDAIRRLQPNAVIYIQGLIPLNEEQINQTNGNKYNLTNEHLRVYNSLMKQVAEEKQVAFLDLYSQFADENQELPAGASKDGVHLTKEYCVKWLDYLKTHALEFSTLYPDGLPAAEENRPDRKPEDGSGQG